MQGPEPQTVAELNERLKKMFPPTYPPTPCMDEVWRRVNEQLAKGIQATPDLVKEPVPDLSNVAVNRHQRRALAARAGVKTQRLGAKRKRRLANKFGPQPVDPHARTFAALDRAAREGGVPDYAWLDGVPL